MIKGFAHICFHVRDLDASIEYYGGKLGFAHGYDYLDENGARYGVYLHIGGRSFIELFRGNLEPRSDKQSYRHFCLEVEDIEATTAQLRDQGVAVTPVKTGKDHSLQAWLTDPDGNRIELHQYTRESRQNEALNRASSRR